jgi:hypothetical protein
VTTTILALWWIFLIAALLITIVDIYFLRQVVHLCRQIRILSRETLPAALGIARNTEGIQALKKSVELMGSVSKKTTQIEELAGVVAKQSL